MGLIRKMAQPTGIDLVIAGDWAIHFIRFVLFDSEAGVFEHLLLGKP
jgi:hypothetical protein